MERERERESSTTTITCTYNVLYIQTTSYYCFNQSKPLTGENICKFVRKEVYYHGRIASSCFIDKQNKNRKFKTISPSKDVQLHLYTSPFKYIHVQHVHVLHHACIHTCTCTSSSCALYMTMHIFICTCTFCTK